MSNIHRLLAQAKGEMSWRFAHIMHRAHKNAARRILAGQPSLNVRERPMLIARRYIRFLAFLRRKRADQLPWLH